MNIRVGGAAPPSIAAAYGNQFFLQSRDGPVTLDTAQVSMLDVRGGAQGVDIGGMSGVLLAHASPSPHSDSKVVGNSSEDLKVGLNVSFDQVGVNPSASGVTRSGAAGCRLMSSWKGLCCVAMGWGHYRVAQRPVPLNLDLNLRSALSDGVTLPDGIERGEYTPGRQAAAGFLANAIAADKDPSNEGLSPAKTIFEGTVDGDRAEGWLRSGPRAKGRGGRGGSGKIRMDHGNILDPKDSSSRPSLSAISDGKVSISVAGWMDRIRSKFLD